MSSYDIWNLIRWQTYLLKSEKQLFLATHLPWTSNPTSSVSGEILLRYHNEAEYTGEHMIFNASEICMNAIQSGATYDAQRRNKCGRWTLSWHAENCWPATWNWGKSHTKYMGRLHRPSILVPRPPTLHTARMFAHDEIKAYYFDALDYFM